MRGVIRLHLTPKELARGHARNTCEGSGREPAAGRVEEQANLINSDEYNEGLTQLVERVNGFVYQGDRLDAVIDTIAALRSDPGLARLLLQV